MIPQDFHLIKLLYVNHQRHYIFIINLFNCTRKIIQVLNICALIVNGVIKY